MSLATPESSDNEEGNTTSYSHGQHIDSQDALQAIDSAYDRLQLLLGQSGSFKQVATHRDVPVAVLESPSVGGHPKESKVYRASLSLPAKPSEVYDHVRQPQEWDEWRPESRMVSDVDDDSSLIYTVLESPGSNSSSSGNHQVDTATVERMRHTADGSIFHVSTSIASEQIPLVQGRHRASIAIQAWAILPQADGTTTVVYFIQLADRTLRHPFKLSMRRQSISKHASHCVANLKASIAPPSTPEPAAAAAAAAAAGSSSNPDSTASSLKNGTASPSALPERKRMLSLTPSSFRKRNKPRRSALSVLRRGSNVNEGGASTPASSTSSLPMNVNGSSSGAALASASPAADAGAAAPTDQQEAQPDASQPCLLDEGTDKSALESTHKEFLDLLKQSAGWSVSQTPAGERMWTSSVEGSTSLPRIKVETVIKGSDTESILGAITSAVARSTWQRNFRGSHFDGSHHFEHYAGIYPHLKDFRVTTQRAIKRSRNDILNPQIWLVSKSVEGRQPDDGAQEAQVLLEGWHLHPRGRDVVVKHIRHLQVQPQAESWPAHIPKVMAAENAMDLSRLKALVEDLQIPPTFVRWGPGLRYLNTQKGLKDSAVQFEVASAPEGDSKTSASKSQRSWLSIHKNPAFVSGADLTCEPSQALTSVASVSEFPGVWQLTWAEDASSSSVAKVSVHPAQVERGLLRWQDQPVQDSVAAPRGAGQLSSQEEEEADEDEREGENAQDASNSAGAAATAGAGTAAAGAAALAVGASRQPAPEDGTASQKRGIGKEQQQHNDMLTDVKNLTSQQVYFVLLIALLSFSVGILIH